VGRILFKLLSDPQKRFYVDHGLNSTRTVERNTKRHFVLASVANGRCYEVNISWRRFLEYKVSDRTVNNSFALSFNSQETFIFKTVFCSLMVRMSFR
jgi:hypothetical protein